MKIVFLDTTPGVSAGSLNDSDRDTEGEKREKKGRKIERKSLCGDIHMRRYLMTRTTFHFHFVFVHVCVLERNFMHVYDKELSAVYLCTRTCNVWQ